MMYKPLLDSLTIKSSGIDGLGLFAKEFIVRGTNLGMSHIKLGDKIYRTPLGGFINHSNNPNCVKAVLRFTDEDDLVFRSKVKVFSRAVIGEKCRC